MIKKAITYGIFTGIIIVIIGFVITLSQKPKDERGVFKRIGYYDNPIAINDEFVSFYNQLGFNGLELKTKIQKLETLDKSGCIKSSAIGLYNTLNSIKNNPNGSDKVKSNDVECLIKPLLKINLDKLMDYTKYKNKDKNDIDNEFIFNLFQYHIQYCDKNGIKLSDLWNSNGIYSTCCWNNESNCTNSSLSTSFGNEPYILNEVEKNKTKSQYEYIKSYEINYDYFLPYYLTAFFISFIIASILSCFLIKSKV